MSDREKLYGIIGFLLKNYFKELQNIPIDVAWDNREDCFAYVFPSFFSWNKFTIYVNRNVFIRLNRSQRIGLMAPDRDWETSIGIFWSSLK